MQRMIGGEDDYILTSSPCSVDEQVDLTGVSGREVMSFTTVNVKNVSAGSINNLQKLRAELFCQQNTRSNYNNSAAIINIFLILNDVVNHTKSLTTASRDDDLTLVKCQHRIHCVLLVRAELNQRSHRVWDYYSRKLPTRKPSGQFRNCLRRVFDCDCETVSVTE